MVAVPLLIILPSTAVIIRYKNLDDLTLLVLSFLIMGVMILVTLYVVFKQAMVESYVSITGEGLQIVFKRRTLFNWKYEKLIPFGDLAFVSDDIDTNNSREFFTLKVKGETGKIILIAPKKAPQGEMENFSLELAAAVKAYNANYPAIDTRIKTGSFYTGKFAIILNWVLIIAAVFFTVVKIMNPSSVDWYRLVWLYVVAGSWLANFYFVKKKQTQKN